jgi:hypothetical protein
VFLKLVAHGYRARKLHEEIEGLDGLARGSTNSEGVGMHNNFEVSPILVW